MALTPHEVEEFFRLLAKGIAPYQAGREASGDAAGQSASLTPAELSPDFDDGTCERFVQELGTGVLERAVVLFEALATEGKIDSVALSERLGLASPSKIGGALTTSLKRRAERLGLPLPFNGGLGSDLPYGGLPNPAPGDDPGRTHWSDRDGIAERMLDALRVELDGRRRTVAERVLDGIQLHPGISDGELRRQLGLLHQHVNQEARALERGGVIERRRRADNIIGNWPVAPDEPGSP